MEFTSIATDDMKRMIITERKNGSKKEKNRHQSIDEWSIKLPLDVENTRLNQQNEEQLNNNELSLHLTQLLTRLIRQIREEKYQSSTLLQRILNCANKQTLSQLWNIQYTNHLSLSSYLIQKALSNHTNFNNNKSSPISNINSHAEDHQNKEESNLQNEQLSNGKENKKKKRKIKKSNHHKKTQNTQHKDTIKPQTPIEEINPHVQISKPYQNQQQIITILNSMHKKIQQQLLKLQSSYLQQIQTIHILPYIEAENKLIECETKNVKKNFASKVINPEKYYPLEGMQRQLLSNNNSYGLNNYSNSGFNNNRININNPNFPLMSYQYGMMNNSNNNNLIQSQYHQYHQLSDQHQMKTQFNIPLMSMTQGFNQHLTQMHAQYLHNQGIFPTTNGQYMSQNLMNVNSPAGNMTTLNRSGVNVRRIQQSTKKQNKMIDIQNVDDDDDGVEEIMISIKKC